MLCCTGQYLAVSTWLPLPKLSGYTEYPGDLVLVPCIQNTFPLISPYKTINDTPSRVPTWRQTAISTYYLIVTLSEFDISGDHFVFVLCLSITVMMSMTELHCNQSLWQKLI